MFESVERALSEGVGALDCSVVDGATAARLVDQFSRMERLCAAGKALAARRVAECGTWRRSGDRSPAHWLARHTGSSVGSAVGVLETAERLSELPATASAFRSGQLSEAQAKEITSAAAAVPEAEASLLRSARIDGVAGLRDKCRRLRAVDHADIHRSRSLRHWTDPDGAFRLDLRTTAADGAVVLAGLEPHLDRIFRAARDAGRREPYDAYAADALVALARGEQGPPATVHVVVDHAALVRGEARAGERCEMDGMPVPVEAVRTLLPDAFLTAVATDGTDVTRVAHLGRQVTAAQRTALEVRDPECVVPGCHVRTHLEIDHVTGWAITHRTELADLARLCSWHHRQKSYAGARLEGSPGAWTWEEPP